MQEGLQEGGVPQQAAQALLQDLRILQCPLQQEMPEELGRCGVAEEGQVEVAGLTE